jgi:hypothetical protein
MIGVLLGVFGYLFGARWFGSTMILVSTVATLTWWLAFWHHDSTGIYSPKLLEG